MGRREQRETNSSLALAASSVLPERPQHCLLHLRADASAPFSANMPVTQLALRSRLAVHRLQTRPQALSFCLTRGSRGTQMSSNPCWPWLNAAWRRLFTAQRFARNMGSGQTWGSRQLSKVRKSANLDRSAKQRNHPVGYAISSYS
jgi:hypothetical protein